jgi:hypothetical protein
MTNPNTMTRLTGRAAPSSTSDQALSNAIGQLADAYQEFYHSNGTSKATEAVAVASKKVDSICPGATS